MASQDSEKHPSESSSQQEPVPELDPADQLTSGGDALSKKHREEILKQYDMPKVSVNIFTLLRYGDSLDFALQIVGSIFSIAGGSHFLTHMSSQDQANCGLQGPPFL